VELLDAVNIRNYPNPRFHEIRCASESLEDARTGTAKTLLRETVVRANRHRSKLLAAVALATLIILPNQSYATGGNLDITFGTGGKVTTDFLRSHDHASALAIQPDGKIIAAGSADESLFTTSFALARYNTDGSLDSTFGNGGRIITYLSSYAAVDALAIQPDGKIIAAGGAHVGPPGGSSALLRYNADGSLDSTFGGRDNIIKDFLGGGSWAGAVVIQSDGKIVIAGVLYGADWDFALARYDSEGRLDTTFGINGMVRTDFSGPRDYATGLAILADGKIIAAGVAGSTGKKDFALARYNNDGTVDTTFGINGKVTTDFFGSDDEAYDLVIQSDGSIVLAGSADQDPLPTAFALARYKPDGSLDSTFGNGGRITTSFSNDAEANSLVIQLDGKIVTAGVADGVTGNKDFAIARYKTDGTLDASFGADGKVTIDFLGGDDEAYAMAIQSDGKIVMAGDTGASTNNQDFALARFDDDSPRVSDLRMDPANVQVGGTFNATFSGTNLNDGKYFDIRFRSPGSTRDEVVLSWQQGRSARHAVPAGTASGVWTINGVRAHEVETDHTGSFIPVNATVTVSP
jgi:uncharacterized delta-60 repeat protein